MRADFKILDRVTVQDAPIKVGGSLVVEAGEARASTPESRGLAGSPRRVIRDHQMQILSSKTNQRCAISSWGHWARPAACVDSAADEEQADFLAQTERYDAMVLDLGLPKIDGLTLLKRWRDAGVTVPILVLTARGAWRRSAGHRRRRGRLCRQAISHGGSWRGYGR